MAGKITEKRPPVKLTVGAQYICFNVPGDSGEWTSTFETEVIKLPTVTQVQITDNADSYDSYASGSIYDSDTDVPTKDIATTNLAFPDTLLAKSALDGVFSIRRKERCLRERIMSWVMLATIAGYVSLQPICHSGYASQEMTSRGLDSS